MLAASVFISLSPTHTVIPVFSAILAKTYCTYLISSLVLAIIITWMPGLPGSQAMIAGIPKANVLPLPFFA